MSWLGDIFKRSSKDYEARGDMSAKQNDWIQAKLEYESALAQLKKDNFVHSYQIEQLQKKNRRVIEALVLEHLVKAKNLIKDCFFDDALELLKLASVLTEDENSMNETKKLIKNALEHGKITVFEEDVETSLETESESYFTVLIESLPEAQQKTYPGYGENFRRGYLALSHGDYETAAKSLAQAMQENGLEGFIPFELASALINLERIGEAKPLLEGFILHHPNFYPAYRMLSEIYWDGGEHESTEELLSNLPKKLNESMDISILRGESKYRAGKFSEAETIFLHTLECCGWDRNVAIQLAKVNEAAGEPYLASKVYEKIMANYAECREQIPTEIKRVFADLSFAAGERVPTLLQLYLSLAEDDPDNAGRYYENVSQIYDSWDDQESALEFQTMSKKNSN